MFCWKHINVFFSIMPISLFFTSLYACLKNGRSMPWRCLAFRVFLTSLRYQFETWYINPVGRWHETTNLISIALGSLSPTFMMTSSNRNIFRVTGPLCGEFTTPGEFPTQKPVTRSVDVILICAWINDWVNNREAGDLRRHRGHYDVILMFATKSISSRFCIHGFVSKIRTNPSNLVHILIQWVSWPIYLFSINGTICGPLVAKILRRGDQWSDQFSGLFFLF